MKLQRTQLLLLILTFALGIVTGAARAQSTKQYKEMTQTEQAAFVATQARRIARQASGRDYQFTTAFEAEIRRAVDAYARRAGNNGGAGSGKSDLRFVLERGTAAAPTVIKAFKAHNVSPLIGLYLAFIESEYINLASPNAQGATGMFQFVLATGEQLGLSADELLDVEKSADAAARYIAAGLRKFSTDQMKEALAMLAYNRGANSVEEDVAMIVNEQNRSCSICALTEQRDHLDQTFHNESVYYVPRFFAAAIIGENPQAFGLPTQPLSSLK